MADCCEDARRDLHVYLDGELTVEARAVVAVHLNQCPGCCEAFDFEIRLRRAVARCCREEAPDTLRIRVVEAITSEVVVIERPPRASGRPHRR